MPFIFAAVDTSVNKFEEARKKREERKLERQKLLEARRASKPAHNIAAKKL